jgi:hypothetical protein
VALIIVGGALVFVATYRPRMRLPDALTARDTLAVVPGFPAARSGGVRVPPRPAPAVRDDEATAAARAVPGQVAAVLDLWDRARRQLPGFPADQPELAAALDGLRSARLLVDSARLVLDQLRGTADVVERAGRQLELDRRYESGRFRAALVDAQALLDAEQADVKLMFDNLELAVSAAAGGDAADAEIKAGVAGRYDTRSRKRLRQLTARVEALREATRRFLAGAAR